MKHIRTDLTRGNILKGILMFALPMLISSIFQHMYNTVDTMIVGHALGEMSLAAMGSCSAIYDLLTTFALGMGSGMSIVISRSFGAGDGEKLKRSVAGTLIIGFAVAIVLTVAAMATLHPLMRMLDTPAEVLEEAYGYISVVVGFLAVTFAYNLFSGMLSAVGNSFMPLVFLVIASVANILLDILFIVRWGMGVAGAAWATVIAQGISALLCGAYIARRCRWMLPEKCHFRPEPKLYGELTVYGLSVALMNALVFAGTLILQRAINRLGPLLIAGHTAARKINSFCLMPTVTMGSAVATFVSQNHGADNRGRIIRGIGIGSAIVIVWGVAVTGILVVFAPALAKIVSGSGDAVVLENISRYLWFNAPFYAVLGILLICRLSMQSLGEKVIPIVSSCIELVGKILFAVIFVPRMGYDGVILCEPLVWCIMTMLLLPSLMCNPYLRNRESTRKIHMTIY